jgi:hypothetical protein
MDRFVLVRPAVPAALEGLLTSPKTCQRAARARVRLAYGFAGKPTAGRQLASWPRPGPV